MARGLDDTRRNIKADELDDLEKKQLFNKFREHGGEVIKNGKKKPLTIDRSKQREMLARQGKAVPPPKPPPPRAKPLLDLDKKQSGSGLGRFFERVILWFRSTTAGVMEGGGGTLSNKFFRFLTTQAQTRLLDLRLVVQPLAQAKPELRPKLLAGLTRLGSIYYELVVRVNDFYDEEILQELTRLYSPTSPRSIIPRSIGESLREFYKRIYIMRNFGQSATTAIIRALEIQAKEENLDGQTFGKNCRLIKRNLDFVFNELLPKLHLAVLNILRRNFWYGHPELEDFLDLGEEDRIGSITERINQELSAAKSKQDFKIDAEVLEQLKEKDSNEIVVAELDEQIRNGLEVMRELPENEHLVGGRDQDEARGPQDKSAKAYHAEYFFEVFDREYSFVLTSNKIKIALDYQDGKRKDVKKLLSEGYFALDETRSQLKEYNRIINERNRVNRSTQYTPAQRSQLLHKLDIDRSRTDNRLRRRFGEHLARIESALRLLIDDHQGPKHLLQNPDEVLRFDLTGEGKRRLEGRPIIEAIKETWSFVSALRFRLLSGDLSGLGAKIEQSLVFQDDQEAETENDESPEVEDSTEETSTEPAKGVSTEKPEEILTDLPDEET